MLNFKDLKSILKHATRSDGGQFYRNLYGMNHEDESLLISSIKEWEDLTPFTKDNLIDLSLSERSFLPISELDHLRASSGTSGKPPLFSPRTKVRNMDYRLEYYDFKDPFMAFGVPMMPHWHEDFMRSHDLLGRVVVFDPQNPAVSVSLARIAGVKGMSLFVYHVQTVGELMKKNGMNKDMRFIEITGEACSHLLYEYMSETFPNATIVQSYGSSEVEDVHIGMPCKEMDGSEPLAVYHPKDTHYLEILNTETGEVVEPKEGVEGELLITAYPGEPSAFPLIRYRIGDKIRVVKDSCPHGKWSFCVLGRAELDFVKVPGGVLRVDEISRVLRLFHERVSDLFELHCYTEKTSDTPLLKPILHVETKGDIDIDLLTRDIEKELRTGPSFTYEQGVKQGRYIPLEIVELSKKESTKKHKWIVKH